MNELPSWSGRALETEPERSGANEDPSLQDGSQQTDPQTGPQHSTLHGDAMAQQHSPQQHVPLGPVHQEPRRSGLVTGLIFGLLAGLLLAAVGVGAYWLGRQDSDEVAAIDPAPASTDDDASGASDAEDGTGADGEAAEGTGSGTTLAVDPADGEDAAGEDAGAEDTAGQDGTAGGEGSDLTLAADGVMAPPADYQSTDPNYETRIQNAPQYAVVRGGMVYLYGFSQSQEDLEEAMAVTEAVMGPDGYVVERFVDPDTPESEGAPIYVDDKVLFDFNSTELAPDSLPILDLGIALMLQNPTARMLIIARSDAVGSADANLEISQRRGEAVVDYWVSKGVERSRMTVEARGEADATDNDSPEVAALNRSVQFVVSDIDQD